MSVERSRAFAERIDERDWEASPLLPDFRGDTATTAAFDRDVGATTPTTPSCGSCSRTWCRRRPRRAPLARLNDDVAFYVATFLTVRRLITELVEVWTDDIPPRRP